MAESRGHVTGVGGIFVRSKGPKALAAWYRDMLGLPVEAWGGALLGSDPAARPPHTVWAAFNTNTDYMQPSPPEFMLNLAVDDLDAFVARLHDKGVAILARNDNDPSGKFAWIMDPDGTKIELWQPKTA